MLLRASMDFNINSIKYLRDLMTLTANHHMAATIAATSKHLTLTMTPIVDIKFAMHLHQTRRDAYLYYLIYNFLPV